jgi:hypothetical protein
MGTWAINQIATFPDGQISTTTPAIVGDNIYICGHRPSEQVGSYYKDLWRYNISNDVWTKLETMPTCSEDGNISNIHLLYIPTTNELRIFGAGSSNTFSVAYDLGTSTWGSSFDKFTGLDTGIFNGVYYYPADQMVYIIATNRILKYNPLTKAMTVVTTPSGWNLQNTRGIVGILDQIYILGGRLSGVYRTGIIQYDITRNMVFDKPNIPVIGMMDWPIAWAVGSNIYVIEKRAFAGVIKVYNINTEIWSDALPSSGVPHLYQTGAVVYQGKGIIIGGSNTTSVGVSSINQHSYYLDKPTNITGQFVNDTIILNWQDNSTEEQQYILERKRDDEVLFTRLATLSAGTTTYTDVDIDIETHSYTYRIKCRMVIV